MADPDDVGSEQDDVSFLRTDDMICLQCTATGERVCLAAAGFGNRQCYLENIADKNIPADIPTCVFVLEQALSVRALQEMVTATASNNNKETQSGHRTLLYGHAVLLRHQNSSMYLACLSTSSSNDKLAFDVGLQEDAIGEACWWTIHPASKQRSEGEKVRVGDDLILVSVATERYLHTAKQEERAIVNASFHLTHWSVAPFGTGASHVKSVGYVFGGEVLRFFHGGDECLTIPATWDGTAAQNIVIYEGGAVVNQARSLWRLELVRTKWAGGYINWGHPLRITHITTGRYLAFTMNHDHFDVMLVKREDATVDATAFCLAQTKDDKRIILDEKDEEVIGAPLIKYGDTTVFLQHVKTGLWLSYKTYETKKRGVGKVEEKQAIMSEEGKMDDGLEFSRSQEEESRTARVIRKCDNLFNKFIKGLDLLQSNRRTSAMIRHIDQKEMIRCLEDLIAYFSQPEDDIEHEEKQNKLRALRNRQDLFQEEGILNLILEAIDKINVITSQGYLVTLAGEEAGQSWDAISGYLYQLLAAIIMGNHTNCAQFAQSHRLDWLFSRLGSQQAAEGTGMLDVLHCVLIDSPEALNMMKEEHIKVIISLLEKHGRDPKVLDVLSSLCVGNGVAVRSSQNNICDNLLSGCNLMLETQLVDHVASVHPNIYIGKVEGSAMYRKWYYEATLDHIEQITHFEPHLRIGWANNMGYVPHPGGGEKWGGNGVGDDLYSHGFDGANLWSGGRSYNVRQVKSPFIKKGDVIGCAIDLTVPMITFTVNGIRVKGVFKNFNTDGMFYPCISVSARLSCRFLLGGDHGRLKYGPPDGHSAIIEALLPDQLLSIDPCFHFGTLNKGVLNGPMVVKDNSAFVPVPVDTSMISLPNYIETIREKLAENIHETWAMGKIESGWSHGEKRDDIIKKHPCLTGFEKLPNAEKRYVTMLSFQTLKTILALRYHISVDKPPSRIKTVKLHNDPYLQSNGYKPAPLDLSSITLGQNMQMLVDQLAQNTHNVWAKERIRQGWTCGVTEDSLNKRSPHLVQYQHVDDSIKKVNTNTASEAVKTLLAYGYILESPTGETTEEEIKLAENSVRENRTYRAENTYAVTEGKWYFEFEVLTPGSMRVGWCTASCSAAKDLGADESSWAFNGYRMRKLYSGGHEAYGKQWQVGDVVGCMLDLNDRTISFSLNGELLMDSMGGETAFTDIPTNEGFVPACTLGTGQSARLVFGQDVNMLKFFTTCGLQEGYEPFCVNMNRNVAFWYTKDQPLFVNVDDNDCIIDVTRIPPGSDSPPCLKISHKLFETMEKVNYEFLRLSLPVTCHSSFILETEKDKRMHDLQTKFYREKGAKHGHRIPAQLIAQEHMLKSGFSMADIKDLHRAYTEDADETLNSVLNSRHMTVPLAPPPPEKKLTKTQSFDMGISHLAIPNGTPEPGLLRPSTSDETLHKASQDDLSVNDIDQLQSKVDRQTKRGRSPFKFFSKKDKKMKNSLTKHTDSKLSRSDGGSNRLKKVQNVDGTPTAAMNMRNAAAITIVTPSSSELKIVPPIVPDRPNTLAAPTVDVSVLSTPRSQHRKSLTAPENHDLEGDVLEENNLDIINEYFYGVRIFPGQDPNHVYVGWVTTDYHYYSKSFDGNKVRRVMFSSVDTEENETFEQQNCYMVQAGQLHSEVSMHDSSTRSANQGMHIGCHIDISTGIISYTANGKDTKRRLKMEPGTKLFPAIFFEATSKEVLQIELGRVKNTLPLSSALLHSIRKHLTPQLPPRLKVQSLKAHQWARVPNQSLKTHSLKLSDIRGWSMLCEDPVSMLAVHIPEEDRSVDVLELIEHEKLISFHAETLALYGAICYQGNHRAAHIVCKHVDEKQLLYAIESEYMSGPLRTGFADLLIALHLEFHAYARSLTQREYIVPLGPEIRRMYEDGSNTHRLSTLMCTSIRPQMTTTPTNCPKPDNIKDRHTPEFPVDVLKKFVMDALDDAVKKGIKLTRDPIGGTNENLFVPLLKLVDKLLLIGLMTDEDLQWLLRLIDPETFHENYNSEFGCKGLFQMKLDEGVKLQMCYVLHHLCDIQLRHRIESFIAFSESFVSDLQADQLRRYIEIKQSDLPSAVAAKKTREFRCPPREQMKAILSFKNLEEDQSDQCPCNDDIRELLKVFHDNMMKKIKINIKEGPNSGETKDEEQVKPWSNKLMNLVNIVRRNETGESDDADSKLSKEDMFSKRIANTVIIWAKEKVLETPILVREMFHLLLRQYEGVHQLMMSIDKTYIISEDSKQDIIQLLVYLGRIRSLLPVQMGPEEEEVMRDNLWAMVNNKVFFQHPNLIRILGVHENVMDIMSNALGKRAQQQSAPTSGQGPEILEKDTSHEMVVACCRFLCYFCRSSRQNQKAMFDHLDFLSESSNILLSRPSLRGSTPLDVAYSSFMENNELALALREHYLEKMAIYLSRCGLQSNQELLDKGYPDIGWDPVEGERYLDFLRFCVWVNGESVEENANLVIRLLIRRPECLGPALRGEGQGLLQAIREGIRMSEIIAEQNNSIEDGRDMKKLITHPIAEDDDEDYIDMGGAILNFYCALVDLLGRCAPEAASIAQGKNDALRARAILKSLVPFEDLQGVLSLKFTLQNLEFDENDDPKCDLPPGLLPIHKQSIVLFLERVYGVETQETFFKLLEDAFLPDLRAATMIERPDGVESDIALALNRYIGNSILPLLIKYCSYFSDADNYANLLDAILHTVYRLCKMKILTKGQREAVSDFLVALTREMHPGMLLPLLRKLTVDVSKLNEYTTVALRLLTLHFERCGRYYGSITGQGSYGVASEEEKRLTMLLCTNIFDSLAKMEYDPDLFSKALPCLTAISCALPPDYSLTKNLEDDLYKPPPTSDGPYIPQPVNTSTVQLNQELSRIGQKFAQHYHDAWASSMMENGWSYGANYNPERKTDSRLIPFNTLKEVDKEKHLEPTRESLKALLALGWKIELNDDHHHPSLNRTSSTSLPGDNYDPEPVDMSNLTLSRELQTMAARISQNSHEIWAKKTKEELQALGREINAKLVPYDLLTDKEKRANKELSQELMKFLEYQGYKVFRARQAPESSREDSKTSADKNRFASALLEKMLTFLDSAAVSMKVLKPSNNCSHRSSFRTSTRDVKFFSKVVLPLIEKYFAANRDFFLAASSSNGDEGVATVNERKMVANLFCKLGVLLKAKMSVFGSDARLTVRCLQVLIKATDARALVKNCPDFVKTSVLTYFNYAAEDLENTVINLQQGRYCHIRGTTMKTSSSLNYIQLVLLPVLTSMFDHFSIYDFGQVILTDDIQVACYKILHSVYQLGIEQKLFNPRKFLIVEMERHRPLFGRFLGAFASTFPVAFLEPNLNKHNQYSIHGKLEEHSLEAQDVMSQLESSLPTLEDLLSRVEKFIMEGVHYKDAPYVIDVMLPMLCSYLPFWWSQGPDSVNLTSGNHVTMVTSDHLNNLLKLILILIKNNVSCEYAPWMISVAAYAGQVVINSSEDLLFDPVLPLAEKMCSRTEQVFHHEEQLKSYLKSTTEDTSQVESELQEEFILLVRDIYAFYPLLVKYVDIQRGHWLKQSIPEAEQLYRYASQIFNLWSLSQYFRREEQNFITAHEIDNMALIMPSSGRKSSTQPIGTDQKRSLKKPKKRRDKKRDKDKEVASSLMVACLKRLLPVGLNLFAGREQELVQHAKEHFLKRANETEINDNIKTLLTLPDKIDPGDSMNWQHHLYSKLGSKKSSAISVPLDKLVERIIDMAKVLYGLHVIDHPEHITRCKDGRPPAYNFVHALLNIIIDHPQGSLQSQWRSKVSLQRKRAVIACFRMTSLHSLPKHTAINIFLMTYKDVWLTEENTGQEILIEDLTLSFEESEKLKNQVETEDKPDPLSQLVVNFCRNATTEHSGSITEDLLYMSFAEIISNSCSGSDEDEGDECGDEDAAPSIHEQEMEKQKLLFEQARLSERGVAEMILLQISACKGIPGSMVMNTLKLGISLLCGGNVEVQALMLKHLKEKKDVGFFTSISILMNQCGVLDLDAFERNQKAEGLGVGSEGAAGEKNMHDAEETCKIFRFLQLLCEGHNLEFQNYLRTQAGNTTTVNVVICTVDYLLRLQESVMDFYWHYSSKDIIDPPGKENFGRAITVAKQVFNTLTEYLQGPCPLNQQALAHSRLWDAVTGFLFLFAHMQYKLAKHSSQLDVLCELLELQKEMVIMMLSMLEGNVMNGTIGKQMLDTLVESAANVEMILKFFDMFLKLKDLTTSTTFQEVDPSQSGFVTPKEFQRAMEQQKTYTKEEITFLMLCCESSHDEKIDYIEFTERFHNPAKEIGFALAVLLTNLSEHITNDPRLSRFMETASSVLRYFEPFLGRIEILGGSNRIERVYFEIKEANLEQWEKPQIKESKRAFFYGIVTEGGDKEKLEAFVNFCEDAIFEMQHASNMTMDEEKEVERHVASSAYPGSEEEPPPSSLEPVKQVLSTLKQAVAKFLSCLTPSNIKMQYKKFRDMTYIELLVGLAKLCFYSFVYGCWGSYFVTKTLIRFVLLLMGGQHLEKAHDADLKQTDKLALVPLNGLSSMDSAVIGDNNMMMGGGVAADVSNPIRTFGVGKEDSDDWKFSSSSANESVSSQATVNSIDETVGKLDSNQGDISSTSNSTRTSLPQANHVDADAKSPDAIQSTSIYESDPKILKSQKSVSSPATSKESQKSAQNSVNLGEYSHRFLSFLARNFYTMKYAALTFAFMINFCLLFFRVSSLQNELNADDGTSGESGESTANPNAEDAGGEEVVTLAEKFVHLEPLLRLLAILHVLVSFSLLVAYYHLKVPLSIFKREKEIARSLEFDGLYIAAQPSDDDIKGYWDKLVISSRSFPVNYWDKFVKKRVREKYSETFDHESISNLLGMDKCSSFITDEGENTGMLSFITGIDWKYQIWKCGVTITDNSFQYNLWYLIFSALGNYNYFFFAAHLIDVAVGYKKLRTILQSVTHNGKQLVLTMMLLMIIVYIYTVIAFNFFRKFYVQQEDDQVDAKCHDMFTCFMFHLYKGVRAGGGIGDEIEAADGDDYEAYRILFDFTFFFFVIVILLAIIQGLIIDAFGELRDQLQSVVEDMESNCFICGIGKDYFDKVPHGFDTHVQKEHNLANYMFFLMHLINKPDTEYTGQETYVWELYQKRCWDFFPVGDCFRKQYEDELISAG